MSADPDSNSPDAESAPSTPEKLPISAVKHRYRRGNEAEGGENPPPSPPPPRRPPLRGAEISEAPSPPEDDLADEINALDARVRALKAQRETVRTTPPPERETRGAKYHRLERKQVPPPAPRDPATPALEIAAPVALPTPPVVHYAPWHDTTWHPGWLLASGGILALGLLAFFLGRWSSQPLLVKETPPPVTPVWSANEIGSLDNIITADRAGKIDEAYKQAVRLDKQLGNRQGISLYTALLQARMGAVNNAEADLVRGVNGYAPPLAAAAVQDRLGFVYARRRAFKEASSSFAAAAAADPFDAMTFYHWGESLRRGGQLVEAIDKFQAALLRLPPGQPETDSQRECAALRLRLCQIELGKDFELKPVLDQQIRQPVPNVYWLVTAIAYSLQHNDPGSALAALQKARVVAPAIQLDLLFNDYYLRLLAGRYPETSELAAQLTHERRARLDASMAYYIDP